MAVVRHRPATDFTPNLGTVVLGLLKIAVRRKTEMHGLGTKMNSNSISSETVTTEGDNDFSKRISEPKVKDKKMKNSRTNNSDEANRNERFENISLTEELSIDDLVEEWVKVMLGKGIKGLSDEFMALYSITKPTKKSYSIFAANRNSDRNRYRNVVCLNDSRVKLNNHPSGNDYIHANYVRTPFSERRFICTQAPLDCTIYDFWFMIIQEKVKYIIMLTNFIEKGYIKSAQYFPFDVDKTDNYNDIMVTCLTCERREDFECEVWERSLMVQLSDMNPIIVTHFHWNNWPDHGIPNSYSCPLSLLEVVRMSLAPIVLHCSAGIGRTGCLVLIELVLEKFLCKQTCSDMGSMLFEIRKQRAYLIQNNIQYLYVHRTLLQFFMLAGLIRKMDEVREFIKDYDQFMVAKFTAKKKFSNRRLQRA